jgi:hypothetical protein
MDRLLPQPVFAVGDRTFRWSDVVEAARRWSSWSAVERQTREGIACRRHAEEAGDPLSAAEVDDATAAFRYERRLLSADELQAWLAGWDLTVPYWTEFVRRALLRKRWADRLPALLAHTPVGDDEVDGFIGTEAVCSGALEYVAGELAERAAVAAAVAGDAAGDLAHLDDCFARFCAEAASPSAIEREVHDKHVDWLRLDCRWLAHEQQDVVREAALCVREDGRDLETVAADAGARFTRAQTYLESADPALRGHLLGARRGDVLGPIQVHAEFQLVEVLDKVAPSAEDAEIRDRAAGVVMRRAVEGEVVNRVRWHGHLQS